MTLTFTTVFTLASIFLVIAGLVALILTAPGAKRPKQSQR